jgi:hypothetical protein
MEIATPLAAEAGMFVVGSAPKDASKMVQIMATEHRLIIEKLLAELSGLDLKLRVIEGDTAADWQNAQARDRAAEELEASRRQRRTGPSHRAMSWDAVLERLSRMYSEMEYRQFPQNQARYVLECAQVIKEAIQVMEPEWQGTQELWERSLSRAIDKVGTLANVPPAMVALELAHMMRDG